MHPETYEIWTTWTSDSTAITTNVWLQWATTNDPILTPRASIMPDPAVIERHRQQLRVEFEERERALARARETLCRFLTPRQREQLEKMGYFEVRAKSGNVYEIHTRGQAGNVVRRDLATRYCAHPQGEHRVPDPDAHLTQKFLIETDEAAFLRIANARPDVGRAA